MPFLLPSSVNLPLPSRAINPARPQTLGLWLLTTILLLLLLVGRLTSQNPAARISPKVPARMLLPPGSFRPPAALQPFHSPTPLLPAPPPVDLSVAR